VGIEANKILASLEMEAKKKILIDLNKVQQTKKTTE